MEKKEFLDISREYFKQLGFQSLKKSKFYYYAKELALCVWLQHSDYSEIYYINYDIQLKALHNNEQCDGSICDVRGRLVSARDRGFMVEYLLWNTDDYLKVLDELSKKQIVPIMEQGVKYVKKLVRDCESLDAWCIFDMKNRKLILSL